MQIQITEKVTGQIKMREELYSLPITDYISNVPRKEIHSKEGFKMEVECIN